MSTVLVHWLWLVAAKRPLAYSSVYCAVTRVGSRVVGLSLRLQCARVLTRPVSGVILVVVLTEARSDSKRSLLLLIVQGLIWLDRHSFCFSRRFCFLVGIATVGAVVGPFVPFCPVRRLFRGRGEPSSATHRCGAGPVAPVSSASAVATVLAVAPSSVPCSCCRRCCFAGLGDGSRATQR